VNRLNGTIGLSPYHILTSRFPKGLRIEPGVPGRNGMVTARILGSPEPGQGGRYEFMLNWTDQLSTVYSLFRLDVPEAASITSPATFTFFEGTSAAGQVTTQGYPVNSAGVDCGPGIECADMSIRMQWGPRRIQGLTLTDRTPEGTPTGVGRFEGTIPAGSSGVYEASFSAANGRWRPEARQLARLVVLPTPDLNGDGTVDCSDLTAIKNAIGTIKPGPGRGFDLTGDMLADDKDIDAMVRAVPNLCTCQIYKKESSILNESLPNQGGSLVSMTTFPGTNVAQEADRRCSQLQFGTTSAEVFRHPPGRIVAYGEKCRTDKECLVAKEIGIPT
jgi:hypothetical protein